MRKRNESSPRSHHPADRKFTPASTPFSTSHDSVDALAPSAPSTTVSRAEESKTASNLDYPGIFDVYAFATKYDFPVLKLESFKCWQCLSLAGKTSFPDRKLINRIFATLSGFNVYVRRYIAE